MTHMPDLNERGDYKLEHCEKHCNYTNQIDLLGLCLSPPLL